MEENFDELNDVNKFLRDFSIYPHLNFQVTVRLLKDKKKGGFILYYEITNDAPTIRSGRFCRRYLRVFS